MRCVVLGFVDLGVMYCFFVWGVAVGFGVWVCVFGVQKGGCCRCWLSAVVDFCLVWVWEMCCSGVYGLLLILFQRASV